MVSFDYDVVLLCGELINVNSIINTCVSVAYFGDESKRARRTKADDVVFARGHIFWSPSSPFSVSLVNTHHTRTSRSLSVSFQDEKVILCRGLFKMTNSSF